MMWLEEKRGWVEKNFSVVYDKNGTQWEKLTTPVDLLIKNLNAVT